MYTVGAAARLSCCDRKAIWLAIRLGTLPGGRTMGEPSVWLIAADDLEGWIASRGKAHAAVPATGSVPHAEPLAARLDRARACLAPSTLSPVPSVVPEASGPVLVPCDEGG